MLDQNLINQLKSIFSELKNEYVFDIKVSPNHKSKKDMISLLEEVAACSDKISCKVEEGAGMSFEILKNQQASRIVFKAVPTGHEFSSLLLAILNLDGIGKNLPDEILRERIEQIQKPIKFKSYISLSCTNCPEVVQALNVMTILNPHISHEIIDGAVNQEEAKQDNVQAVPTVLLNDKPFHIGRASLGELLVKLQKQIGLGVEKENTQVRKKYDVIVVGGGPAGVSSAIYSARKGFSVAIIAEKVGGQVTETTDIENMISIPKTTGPELASNLMQHLKAYPIDIIENRNVEDVEIKEGVKNIRTSLGELFETPALIIATGASWRHLGVPGEKEYMGSGVAFCTHCDGPFYEGKKVVVVGGGNSGLEAAIDLSSIASEVVVLEYTDTIKGDQILQDNLSQKENVTIKTSVETLKINGDGNKVTSLIYKDRLNGQQEEIETDGVFVQIGLKANSGVFSSIVNTNSIGEIEIDSHCRTGTAGVYAAGDVSIVPYKQIVIAMGEGSKAALSAFDDQIKNRLLIN